MVPKEYEKVATVNIVTLQMFQPQLGFNQSLNKKLEQKANSNFSRTFKKVLIFSFLEPASTNENWYGFSHCSPPL